LSDEAWKTSCQNIKGWDTKKCCPICHEDAESGYEPCEVEINGETFIVCCNCAEYIRNNNIDE
jgi:hypothetical protein